MMKQDFNVFSLTQMIYHNIFLEHKKTLFGNICLNYLKYLIVSLKQ
jgi:hypothetical protein